MIIRVIHRLPPQRIPAQAAMLPASFHAVNGGEMHDQITKQMYHAAGIFLAEATDRSVGPAWIEREDRLQMRRVLPSDKKLLRTKAGYSNHADLAITPWLLSDPLDQIVAVPLPRSAAVRLANAAGRPDM